jgi:hypothetical protein
LVVDDVAALVAGAEAEGLELAAGTAALSFSESSRSEPVVDDWESGACDCGRAVCGPGEDAAEEEAAVGCAGAGTLVDAGDN